MNTKERKLILYLLDECIKMAKAGVPETEIRKWVRDKLEKII